MWRPEVGAFGNVTATCASTSRTDTELSAKNCCNPPAGVPIRPCAPSTDIPDALPAATDHAPPVFADPQPPDTVRENESAANAPDGGGDPATGVAETELESSDSLPDPSTARTTYE